jgi:hypothetical protein
MYGNNNPAKLAAAALYLIGAGQHKLALAVCNTGHNLTEMPNSRLFLCASVALTERDPEEAVEHLLDVA